eukprot:4974353-Pyramimonas_sp.AAC.1
MPKNDQKILNRSSPDYICTIFEYPPPVEGQARLNYTPPMRAADSGEPRCARVTASDVWEGPGSVHRPPLAEPGRRTVKSGVSPIQ